MIFNSHYLKPEQTKKIKEVFLNEKRVILFDFSDNNYYQKLKKEIRRLKFTQESNPCTHSYAQAALPLHVQEVFNSREFLDFISHIINIKTINSSWKIKALRFSWKDYVILHDENKEKPGIDIIVDCTDNWDKKAGGAITYVDGTGNYTTIPIQGNMLAIVQRNKNEQRFVQYVNHYAGRKKRDLVMVTILPRP